MDKEKPQNKKKQRLTEVGKYSAMTFQMAAIIAIGVWGGIKLDEYFGLEKFPVFTLSLSLLSTAGSVYFVIKDLLKK